MTENISPGENRVSLASFYKASVEILKPITVVVLTLATYGAIHSLGIVGGAGIGLFAALAHTASPTIMALGTFLGASLYGGLAVPVALVAARKVRTLTENALHL